MQELLVVEVIPREKGRTSIRFDNGMEVLLYKGEVRKLSLREGIVISRKTVSYTNLTMTTIRIM